MKQLEKMIREELLSAKDQICLSIFVPDGSVKDRCRNLKDLVVEASEILRKVLSGPKLEAFLGPLARIGVEEMERFEGGMAFFRTADTFRAISVPTDLEKECVISNHFNVKPLLKWLQEDSEFVCVDFSRHNVDILRGDVKSFGSVGCFGIGPQDYGDIDSCILDHFEESRDSLVFLSGKVELAKKYLEKTRLSRVDKSIVDSSAYHGDYESLYQVLRDRVRHRGIQKIKQSLLDYNVAVMNGRGRSDLEEVIRAAKEGVIKKLIVSEEEKIWGRFEAYKNNANRINKQINYEDDDLLDSLSEKVIESGGEVVLANSKQMPKGKTVLAILRGAA